MYIVICGNHGTEYLPERRLLDAESWDATVQHIAEGQWENISGVVQTGMARDVLDLMAREVMDIWAERAEPLSSWQREFIEQNVSIQAANKFLQAAE